MPERIPQIAHDLAPIGTSIIRAERMSRAFVKYHLDDHRALHRFTRPEPHSHPHDHPWPFETTVLAGGYVEEVFELRANGSWHSNLESRLPGTVHLIAASHIHRIVDLPEGECWTLVRAGRHERQVRFWRFDDVVRFRTWNARRWSVHRPRVIDVERQLRLDNAW